MQIENNIKDLNVSLEQLYSNQKQLRIHFSDRPNTYSVILKDWKGFDCKISSFADNIYTRTNKGINSEKYASIGTLQTAIKKQIKLKLNDANVKFSVSNEIDYI